MLDTLGMLDTTLGLPEQVAAAAASAAEPDLPRADGVFRALRRLLARSQ